jgi:hypothetical protein
MAADQPIAACGGDAKEAVKALLVANDFLEAQLDELRSSVCRLRARPVRSIAQSHGVIAMDVTYYVALPFVFADDGVAAGEAVECPSANAAVMRAEVLSRKPGCTGAIAFCRTGDPATGEFSDATLIRKFRRRAGRPERAVKLDWVRNKVTRMRR